MFNCFNDEQLWNADDPIFFIKEWKVIWDIVQSLNIFSGISEMFPIISSDLIPLKAL